MKIKYISLKKLQAIKANGYVGSHSAHSKKGKQVDYCDFIAEIDERINSLTESKITHGQLERFNHSDMSFLTVDRLIDDLQFKKTFNHWAYLAQKLTWGI